MKKPKAPLSSTSGAGGGKASVGWMPKVTTTGGGEQGKKAIAKGTRGKEDDKGLKETPNAGEQDVSSCYSRTKSNETGKTDY